jgi:hypothetical protein
MNGSLGEVLNSRSANRRLTSAASDKPSTTPMTAWLNPRPTTSRATSVRRAPSAMRTPISCERCATSWAMTLYSPSAATTRPRTPKRANSVAPSRQGWSCSSMIDVIGRTRMNGSPRFSLHQRAPNGVGVDAAVGRNADQQAAHVGGPLPQRLEEVRGRVAGQGLDAMVGDDAHDTQTPLLHIRRQALADRILPRPDLARHALVDDGDHRRPLPVLRGEVAPAQQWRSDCREVVAADGVHVRPAPLERRERVAVDDDPLGPLRLEGDGDGLRHGAHPGEGAQAARHRLPALFELLRRLDLSRDVRGGDEDSGGLVPKVERRGPLEGTHEETSANQEHHGEGPLHHDQRSTEHPATAPSLAHPRLERLHQRGMRRDGGRDRSRQRCRDHRQESDESCRSGVDRAAIPRHVLEERGPQKPFSPDREDQREHSRHGAQHQRLGEEHPCDSRARDAEREVYGELASAPNRAREHQVGHVRAGNQQHQ